MALYSVFKLDTFCLRSCSQPNCLNGETSPIVWKKFHDLKKSKGFIQVEHYSVKYTASLA